MGKKRKGLPVPESDDASMTRSTRGCKRDGVSFPMPPPHTDLPGGYAATLAAQAFRGQMRINRNEFGLGLGCGAAMSLSALAMLAAMRLPAAGAFPVIQGTSLAGGVCLCAAVFRERLTPRKLAALANIIPKEFIGLWNAVKKGDLATARQLQDRIIDVCELLILNPRCFQSACKLVLQKRGIFSTTINTHPLPALDAACQKRILAEGKKLGLF